MTRHQDQQARGEQDKTRGNLVEVEDVEQTEEAAVLLVVLQLHVVLAQTVQREFGVVVHKHLQRVLHELLAHTADRVLQGRAEHHHLHNKQQQVSK